MRTKYCYSKVAFNSQPIAFSPYHALNVECLLQPVAFVDVHALPLLLPATCLGGICMRHLGDGDVALDILVVGPGRVVVLIVRTRQGKLLLI